MAFPDLPALAIAGLAVHQLSFLLSKKEGPWSVFKKIRLLVKKEARESKAIRESAMQRGIECQHCTSVWFAFPVGAFVFFHDSLPFHAQVYGDFFLSCLALSSVSVIINQSFTKDS